MGKITEIIGKRTANVTGEVMVEVGSSKQQLKTLALSIAKLLETLNREINAGSVKPTSVKTEVAELQQYRTNLGTSNWN
jgi:hypothetical protein